jgi:hypothetical protein
MELFLIVETDSERYLAADVELWVNEILIISSTSLFVFLAFGSRKSNFSEKV